MTNQTSEEFKAELVNLFFGINATTLVVERVTETRGGTLTLQRAEKAPSVYRIKDGRPAYKEIQRVFGLTDLVAMSPTSDPVQILTHPLVAELGRIADAMRARRDDGGERDAGANKGG